ncbi:hypothetical protein C3489_06220 [Streptomyces sp. Ru71]|uniref:hypothetical protein n=1 Tax=Streptomyces sp. Ru71 TaxID=2080746 RepID=UPI000CDD2D82|nr:hypothetical protein [Streptomyces sp. Ru71]POX56311.1 hypothetical protein C3489_06220 [Streptomyces sp. Ru71]
MLVSPENTVFVRGATPALLLAAAPVHQALPLLPAPGGAVPRCAGWGIAARLTLCVVDGPGEAGAVVPALGARVVGGTGGTGDMADMADWCSDVERAGGALVVSVDELPEVLDWGRLLASGTARGGFLTSLGRTA